MRAAIPLAFCVVLAHLAGRYLWFESFRRFLPERSRNRMILSFLILGALNVAFYLWIFSNPAYMIMAYKSALVIGWLPYVLLSFYWLPRLIAQQIFVFGMQGLWIPLLHTVSMLTILYFFHDGETPENLYLELSFYLIYFMVSLPLSAHMFRHMVPSRQLINDKAYGYYIALLPILIACIQVPISMDQDLWTMDKILSRLISFASFLALYRYVALQAEDLENEVLLKSSNEVQQKAIRFFQNNMLLIQASMKRFSILRHDMRHQINIIYGLISSGKSEEALRFLRTFDEHLEKTAIHPFCLNPFVNAILSVYIVKAKDAGIPVTCRVNFPEKVPEVQERLSFALANLLENAIRASEKQDKDKRFLHLTLQTKGRQVVLSVENYCATPIRFDREGYPTTGEPDHGTGMTSIRHFIAYYKGYKNFSQENGVVRFEIYFTLPEEGGSAAV
ncbi:GHKL domain-containing protein [uncultured Dialister sp.]|uniref:sensor histidine kinase n=1 Tax=uncultured Dialister sp. TaxID=278064 RepID=UPI0026069486|nr:GHKL domain-containing protein [uncultured Dialister sp.]